MADIANITLKGESEAKNFIDEALRGDIAYEELSTTVSKTGGYVAGDHLIYLGQYYEVVADIAQGGTIVTSGAGQNVEEREVGDEIKKNKTQVVAQIQTLTSAFVNNVNQNGSKNILKVLNKRNLTTKNITFTHNADDSISVSNTVASAIADYVLTSASNNPNRDDYIDVSSWLDRDVDYVLTTGRSANSGVRLKLDFYDVNNTLVSGANIETQKSITFNLTTLDPSNQIVKAKCLLRVGSDTTVVADTIIKPMICLKSDYDLDPTYVPPSKTNLQLTQDSVTWDYLSEVGAVNYLENKAVNTTSSPVTWTVDTNKIVTATVESNLTATNALDINLSFALSAGAYKLSGCPSGVDDGTTTICRLQLYKSDQTTVVALDNGSGAVFTLASDTVLVCKIRLGSGLASGTYTFYPMIAPVSYNGPYVPYAKSNKELTDYVDSFSSAGLGCVNLYDFGNTPSWLNGAFSTKTLEDIIVAMPGVETISKLILGTGINTDTVFAKDLKAKGLHDSGTGIGYMEITKITSYQNRAIVEYTYKDSTSLKRRITSWVNGTWTTVQTIL